MMVKRLLFSLLMVSAVGISLEVTDVSAQPRTKGQELEQRQNKRTDDWATQQKQRAREDAENRATNTGVGREKRVQDREREIDRQAAQRKKDDADARNRLPKEKMDEPYKEKKPDSKAKSQPKR